MKKLSISICISLLILLPILVFAAGTLTCTDYSYRGLSGKDETRVVTYTVTFAADAASPANVALDSIAATAHGTGRPSLEGWWLLRVDTLYGATGPTDDSDLYLWRSWGEDKIDVLGGNGVNSIDNATNNTIYPANVAQPLTGKEIFDVDGNAVANAICTIVFTLYK